MAKVATDVRQHIDYLLDHLFSAWVDLPRVVREIHSWDLVDQLSYIEEWGAQDSLGDVLRKYLSRGQMTEEQQARFEELERLIRENRPILQGLRES